MDKIIKMATKTISFKSVQENYRKEYLSIKTNTIRKEVITGLRLLAKDLEEYKKR